MTLYLAGLLGAIHLALCVFNVLDKRYAAGLYWLCAVGITIAVQWMSTPTGDK